MQDAAECYVGNAQCKGCSMLRMRHVIAFQANHIFPPSVAKLLKHVHVQQDAAISHFVQQSKVVHLLPERSILLAESVVQQGG
eukprot:1144581-Pelagomonas_calceolata.AAC.7